MTISRLKTWGSEVLSASDLNGEFNNIINNLTCQNVDDFSANDSQMQTTADPFPASAISKPTDLSGELARLRYVIAQITGQTYWYVDPPNTAGIATTPTINTIPVATVTGGRLAWGWNPAFRGALAYRTTNQTSIATGTAVTLLWDAEDYDTDSIHSTASNTERLTVPAGVTRIRLGARISLNAAAAGGVSVYVLKNAGATQLGLMAADTLVSQLYGIPLWSPVITVTAGDYFYVQVVIASGSQQLLGGSAANGTSWFAMEIVE